MGQRCRDCKYLRQHSWLLNFYCVEGKYSTMIFPLSNKFVYRYNKCLMFERRQNENDK